MSRSRKSFFVASLCGIGLTAVLIAPVIGQQAASPPIARYDMDAATVSGMAAMGGGMGGGLSMMFGGGGNKQMHLLDLRLGSSMAPAKGAPQADHFMPPVAKLGKSVPLVTPKPGTRGQEPEGMPPDFQRPKGRLLIFWGCGPRAPKGQPVIIDFEKLSMNQVPPGLFSTTIPVERSVAESNSRTFGDWPNGNDRKLVSSDSSLIGEHRIAGNYSPEIKFALSQDFMPAITGKARAMPDNSTEISWGSVANATGYYAWVMGFNPDASGQPRDMVWWSSSATQQFGGGLWDWLSPGTVARLITQKVVMPPSQTSCVMPAEVKQAAGEFMMGNLYAYGPEANFAYPPRPADPKLAWKPDWTARVRYRSNTMWMLSGPDMEAMMRGAEAAEGGETAPPPKKKCKRGLGGLIGTVTGTGC